MDTLPRNIILESEATQEEPAEFSRGMNLVGTLAVCFLALLVIVALTAAIASKVNARSDRKTE